MRGLMFKVFKDFGVILNFQKKAELWFYVFKNAHAWILKQDAWRLGFNHTPNIAL